MRKIIAIIDGLLASALEFFVLAVLPILAAGLVDWLTGPV